MPKISIARQGLFHKITRTQHFDPLLKKKRQTQTDRKKERNTHTHKLIITISTENSYTAVWS